MPSDKEQKKSPEEEAEEKKYSFLQEKIKGKQGSRETLIKQFIRIAIYVHQMTVRIWVVDLIWI